MPLPPVGMTLPTVEPHEPYRNGGGFQSAALSARWKLTTDQAPFLINPLSTVRLCEPYRVIGSM